MAVTTNSDLAKQRHELLRLKEQGKVSVEEFEAKHNELLVAEKEALAVKLNTLLDKHETTNVKMAQTLAKKFERKDLMKLYKESIAFYRDCEELFLASRALKKDIRDRL